MLSRFLTIDKPDSKSQVQAQSQIEKGKRNLDSDGLSKKCFTIVSGPVGNPESTSVHRRSPKSKFQTPGLVPVDSSLVYLLYFVLSLGNLIKQLVVRQPERV